MIEPGERVLVAVSGGKDSPGPVGPAPRPRLRRRWPLHRPRASASTAMSPARYARAFADRPGSRRWSRSTCRAEHGFDIPTAAASTRRVPCSACGLSKRHLFDQAALDGGYDVVATGHNLDDEAAVLFGNVLRWDVELPRPPAAGAAGPPRLPPQGQAARAPGRARDGGLLRACGASTTSSRSARWRPATAPGLQGRAQRRSRRRRPGTKAAFYLGFLERMAPDADRTGPRGDREPRALRRLPRRLAAADDTGEDLRVLPAGRAHRRPRAGGARPAPPGRAR